jgi:hypothetical protein
MSKKSKRTREEMVELAYSLQNAIKALCGKRPVRIETNKDHKLLRVVWGRDYERKDWYDGAAMGILIDAFGSKHGIHIRQIAVEQSKHSAVYLTKASTDPDKK